MAKSLRVSKRSEALYPNYLILPALLIFVVFFVVPELLAFVLSFTDWNINRFSSPKFTGIENFIFLFKDEYFVLSLKNTLVYALASATMKVFFGFILAIAVNRTFKTGNFAKTIFYAPAVLSMIVVGIIFSALFRYDGLFNQLLEKIGLGFWVKDWIGEANTALWITILADVWRWAGFNMTVFLAGLKGIPNDYYEAARVDGASKAKTMFHITIPLLLPAFIINVTYNTIGGLKVFEQVFIITAGGPGYASQVLSTYIYQAFSAGLLGRSTAMGLVLFVLVTFFTLSLNKLMGRTKND